MIGRALLVIGVVAASALCSIVVARLLVYGLYLLTVKLGLHA